MTEEKDNVRYFDRGNPAMSRLQDKICDAVESEPNMTIAETCGLLFWLAVNFAAMSHDR